jgi:tetratricopeptide (TPR) repeat protein
MFLEKALKELFGKRKFFVVLFTLSIFSCPLQASSDLKTSSMSFDQKMKQAYGYAMKGDFKHAAAIYEGLLRTNPEDRRIYDMYSRTLINKGDFDKAILVYEKALQRGNELRHGRMTPIQDEIEQIKTIKKFSEAMGKAPSWDNAHTFHFSKVEMITNIPKEYYIPLAKDIADIIEKERSLLEKIVGPAQKDASYFKMIVPGRFKEYQET